MSRNVIDYGQYDEIGHYESSRYWREQYRLVVAENASLRDQLAAKDEALWQAAILADIASDWNLDEIEIDGEMVLTYDLHKRLMQAREGSSSTGEDE